MSRALWIVLALVLVLGGAAGWWFFLRSDPDDVPPPPERLLVATSTYALLVGCTEYPTLKSTMDAGTYDGAVRLEGPENDVQLMRTALRDYLGVPDENITVLSGWPGAEAARPTKANILAHLSRLARDVPKGGRVVFQFAGHGSQEPDQEHGDELDRLDELLLPADVAKWDRRIGAVPGSISDDEMRAALVPLVKAGLTVWAILDCCHAGTAMRGSDVRMRELDSSLLGVPSAPVGSAAVPQDVLRDTAAPLSGVVAFYAVQSNQLAPEMTLPLSKTARGREPHGLLSFVLARTLMRFGGALTFRELFGYLQAAYEAMPYPSATPNAEGDMDLIVSGACGKDSDTLQLDRDPGGWSMDGGRLRGVTKGSIVEAFRPGCLGDGSKRVGTLEVTEVGVLRSALKPVAGDFPTSGDVPARLPGRMKHVAAGDVLLHLAVVDEKGVVLPPEKHPAALRLELAEPVTRARLPLTPAAEADWILQVHPPDGTRASGAPRFAFVPGRAHGVARECDGESLDDTLYTLFRAHARRHVVDTDSRKTLPAGLQQHVVVVRVGGTEPEPLGADTTLQPGDAFRLLVQNQTYKDVHVSATYFDADGSMADLVRGQTFTAADTGETELVRGTLLDDAFGEVRLVLLASEATPGSTPPCLDDVGWPSRVNRAPATTRGAEAENGVPAAASATFRTEWGRLGIPSRYNDTSVPVEPAAVVANAQGTGEVDLPGVGVRWTRAAVVAGDEQRADVLLLWGEGGLGALVDADGDARLTQRPPADLARDAAAGRLPVEVSVLLLGNGQRSARYRAPVGVDGTGLVLVDTNGDAQAEARWVERDGSWWKGPAWTPWLSSIHLGSGDLGLDAAQRRRVTAALRLLAKPAR